MDPTCYRKILIDRDSPEPELCPPPKKAAYHVTSPEPQVSQPHEAGPVQVKPDGSIPPTPAPAQMTETFEYLYAKTALEKLSPSDMLDVASEVLLANFTYWELLFRFKAQKLFDGPKTKCSIHVLDEIQLEIDFHFPENLLLVFFFYK